MTVVEVHILYITNQKLELSVANSWAAPVRAASEWRPLSFHYNTNHTSTAPLLQGRRLIRSSDLAFDFCAPSMHSQVITNVCTYTEIMRPFVFCLHLKPVCVFEYCSFELWQLLAFHRLREGGGGKGGWGKGGVKNRLALWRDKRINKKGWHCLYIFIAGLF